MVLAFRNEHHPMFLETRHANLKLAREEGLAVEGKTPAKMTCG